MQASIAIEDWIEVFSQQEKRGNILQNKEKQFLPEISHQVANLT